MDQGRTLDKEGQGYVPVTVSQAPGQTTDIVSTFITIGREFHEYFLDTSTFNRPDDFLRFTVTTVSRRMTPMCQRCPR